MKTRVISGTVIAAILISAFVFMFTPIIDIFFIVLATAACYEIVKITGIRNKVLKVLAIAYAVVLPVLVIYAGNMEIPVLATIAYVIVLIALTVFSYSSNNIEFKELAMTIYASVVVPTAFATIGLVSNAYLRFEGAISQGETRILLWDTVATALLTDVFAYFVGVKFGKHKMSPHLSPKKSIEGAVGGVVLVTLFQIAALFVFEKILHLDGFFMPIWFYIITTVFISLTSMVGDLMASLIKRDFGVKDYSNLIPGHGGIMDRFDSVILASPTMYILVTLFGLVAFK
ncbi:MAG: phosphatidate cytidylyltransferase [Clostridia bacterium]|nr:phosphatidate cytidylyltransferase [Clostridia bacterium]